MREKAQHFLLPFLVDESYLGALHWEQLSWQTHILKRAREQKWFLRVIGNKEGRKHKRH